MSIMGYNRKAFTFIELIMTIAIVGILALSGAYVLVYVVQNSVFIPNQLNMNMMASDAMDLMIEGDTAVPGLRFSRAITSIPDGYQVTFINQNNQTVRYRFDPVTSRLWRCIGTCPPSAETLIPYYVKPGTSLLGKNNKLFEYFDAAEAPTITPANVRWIRMTLIAQTGTGSYSNWEGQSEQMTSVAVNRYQ